MKELILVLDFGGQYKELIAQSVRWASVYCEIYPGNISIDKIKELSPIGIILTGGPSSVYNEDSPKCDPLLFSLGIPILGICYGMHLMCHMLGGEVESGGLGEYGRATVIVENFPDARINFPNMEFLALMSHRDRIKQLPKGFVVTSRTKSCIASFQNKKAKLYGVQFHPETKSTITGKGIIKKFLYDVCGAKGDYILGDYINLQIEKIRRQVKDKKVLLALSGGVDSSVCAALLSKAVPNQLVCIFVDHGFMRLDEGDEIERIFSKRDTQFIRVNAQNRFLKALKGVSEPEKKRKIIGEEFIAVFEEESAKLGDIPFLAQGTIYPDIVESGGGHGATIKSHHNVGGLPVDLAFQEVIEPLSGLFKNEVRKIGTKIGLPKYLVNRQPFPGPGLAIRIIGEVTDEKLDVLRRADAIVREEFYKLKNKPDQYFAVLTDTRTVGVKGDDRTFDPVIAVRAVTTGDFMTCEYAPISQRTLSRTSLRITSEIAQVSRVVYDITGKPPATVEWE